MLNDDDKKTFLRNEAIGMAMHKDWSKSEVNPGKLFRVMSRLVAGEKLVVVIDAVDYEVWLSVDDGFKMWTCASHTYVGPSATWAHILYTTGNWFSAEEEPTMCDKCHGSGTHKEMRMV